VEEENRVEILIEVGLGCLIIGFVIGCAVSNALRSRFREQ
jgi:uncharacterized membrane protein (Fun14 family)